MSFAEVLAAASELTADERRELARELSEPDRETNDELLRRLMPAGSEFEVWSPWDAHEAAGVLQQLLEQERAAK